MNISTSTTRRFHPYLNMANKNSPTDSIVAKRSRMRGTSVSTVCSDGSQSRLSDLDTHTALADLHGDVSGFFNRVTLKKNTAVKLADIADRAAYRHMRNDEAKLRYCGSHKNIVEILPEEPSELPAHQSGFSMSRYTTDVSSDLKTARMSVYDARQVVLDTSRALVHVHELGVVHCDVKASNIMRDDNHNGSEGAQSTFRLGDFGLAHFHWEGRRKNAGACSFGRVSYAAPELKGDGITVPRGRHTAQSDIYAVGMLARHVLVGGTNPLKGVMEERDAVWPCQADDFPDLTVNKAHCAPWMRPSGSLVHGDDKSESQTLEERYFDALHDVVLGCAVYDASERWTLANVIARLERAQ